FEPFLDIHSDEIKFRVMVVRAIEVSEDSDLNLDAGEGVGTSGMSSQENNDHGRMLSQGYVTYLDLYYVDEDDVCNMRSHKSFPIINERVMVVQAIDVSEDSDLNLDAGEGAGTSGMRSPGNNDHSRMLPKGYVTYLDLYYVDEDDVCNMRSHKSFPIINERSSKINF
ncbi:hypothetical protein Tco_1129432, partial [Tanacetum coccineum]